MRVLRFKQELSIVDSPLLLVGLLFVSFLSEAKNPFLLPLGLEGEGHRHAADARPRVVRDVCAARLSVAARLRLSRGSSDKARSYNRHVIVAFEFGGFCGESQSGHKGRIVRALKAITRHFNDFSSPSTSGICPSDSAGITTARRSANWS